MKTQLLEYLMCTCGCGCENDGDWHYKEPVGCRCASLGCPCVIDKPELGVLVLRVFTHDDGRECDLIRPSRYVWRIRYVAKDAIGVIGQDCRRSHLEP